MSAVVHFQSVRVLLLSNLAIFYYEGTVILNYVTAIGGPG